jgi:hypothetical protein
MFYSIFTPMAEWQLRYMINVMILTLQSLPFLSYVWFGSISWHSIWFFVGSYTVYTICFRISNFYGPSTAEETWVVEMRIWCIEIDIVLVLHVVIYHFHLLMMCVSPCWFDMQDYVLLQRKLQAFDWTTSRIHETMYPVKNRWDTKWRL